MYTVLMKSVMAIVLAAGKGTRFNSDRPKVLHHINNKPMVHHVIDAITTCNITNICLVVGYKKDDVISECSMYDIQYATQNEQLGTGHAVLCAIPEIRKDP